MTGAKRMRTDASFKPTSERRKAVSALSGDRCQR